MPHWYLGCEPPHWYLGCEPHVMSDENNRDHLVVGQLTTVTIEIVPAQTLSNESLYVP